MRYIDTIAVHCSATRAGLDIGSEEIRKWHVEGNGWKDIGYHYVIRRDGLIEEGRPVERQGAHVRGYNTNSIGICLIGGINDMGLPDANFAISQYMSLRHLVSLLKSEHPIENVLGHRDFLGVNKACPCFDVKEILK